MEWALGKINMKQLIIISSLFLLLLSCGEKVSDETEYPIGWSKNEILSWQNDTLTCIFYFDTIRTTGPLKYACFHYNRGLTYFDESVKLMENESYPELVNRLELAMKNYGTTCSECGDEDYYLGTLQNLDIIKIYSHIKMNQADSALAYLIEKYPE